MGVDIWCRTELDIEHDLMTALSRPFGYFCSGPDAYGENCEFNQVQQLLDIDLTPLQLTNYSGIDSELSGYDDYIQWKVSEAASEAERQEILAEAAIERVLIAEREEKANKQWNDIGEFTKLIQLFKQKVEAFPDLRAHLQYNFDWSEYFLLEYSDTD
jgi:hypothetical protein